MIDGLTDEGRDGALPIWTVTKAGLDAFLEGTGPRTRVWLKAAAFSAAPGSWSLIPSEEGGLSGVAVGVAEAADLWQLAALPAALPPGTYRLSSEPDDKEAAGQMALGWALGTYVFSRYRKPTKTFARLIWPKIADRREVMALVSALRLARDLINTPAEDLGPAELAAAAAGVARTADAVCRVISGDDLLTQNYPTIHAVGRASSRPPCLIDITWGNPLHPKVTLVGKGVCFDTGGLDLKAAAGMKLMKKDMGGAATALGIAHVVMATSLPVRLRVLVPAVENSVSANAFRPMDIIRTRKGITVEVGNTDAEGRLILCDALAEADTEKPDVLIDFATLTGAARVALGPELPALFSNDDRLAADLLAAGTAAADPVWRMPLWAPYRPMLDSKAADINNVSDGGFAGAITAALYLQEFVSAGTPWAHLDMMSWNPSSKPGRPEGGEGMAVRGVWRMLRDRFGAALQDASSGRAAVDPPRP